MRLKPLLLLPAAACAVLLVGCSSDDTDTAATGVTATEDLTCPTTPAPADITPQWTIDGVTGNAELAGSTKDHGPLIKISAPFSVAETTVKTLTDGAGQVVKEGDQVFVCYEGVNGRDGEIFDSSYRSGSPIDFPARSGPGGVVPGFVKALVDQKVGSTVGVAMTSEDGYGPGGNPPAGIQGTDTLVFELKILKIGS